MRRVVLDGRDFENSDEETWRKTPKALSDMVRGERMDGGFTQEEFARRCMTRQSRISAFECGRTELSIEFLVRVASAVGKRVEITIV